MRAFSQYFDRFEALPDVDARLDLLLGPRVVSAYRMFQPPFTVFADGSLALSDDPSSPLAEEEGGCGSLLRPKQSRVSRYCRIECCQGGLKGRRVGRMDLRCHCVAGGILSRQRGPGWVIREWPSAAPNGGYLEWFGNRAWSAVTFAALTCRRRVCGRVAVNLVRRSFAGVLGALEAELAGDLLA